MKLHEGLRGWLKPAQAAYANVSHGGLQRGWRFDSVSRRCGRGGRVSDTGYLLTRRKPMTMTMTMTAVPTFTPPALAAPSLAGWCHDCDLDLDEACLATQTRGSLDGEIAVCDMHADWYDELARDDMFGALEALDDDDGDLLDVAIAVG